MFRQMSYYIFSIFILLTFSSTNVHSATCAYGQRQCYNYPYYWCCPSSYTCSSNLGYCYSTILSTGAIVGIVIAIIVFCSAIVGCCVRLTRQRRTQYITTTSQSQPIYNPGAAPPPYGSKY